MNHSIWLIIFPPLTSFKIITWISITSQLSRPVNDNTSTSLLVKYMPYSRHILTGKKNIWREMFFGHNRPLMVSLGQLWHNTCGKVNMIDIWNIDWLALLITGSDHRKQCTWVSKGIPTVMPQSHCAESTAERGWM